VDRPSTLERLELIAHAPRLALLVDLDGTLIPFAPTVEDAVLAEDVASRLRTLGEVGVQVVVVSGRPRASIDDLLPRIPGAWWVAEHGAWRKDGPSWRGPTVPGTGLGELAARLGGLVAGFTGARIEHKTLSVCVHWRQVDEEGRAALVPAVELAVDDWLESHPDHDRLAGADMLEVRPTAYHKGIAVSWTRERLEGAPIVAIGDDVTDEDMFRALGAEDVGIAVGQRPAGRSHAAIVVDDVAGVHDLLAWLAAERVGGRRAPAPARAIESRAPGATRTSLLVISNRTPVVAADPRKREVGGLVAALGPALQRHGGVWLGWSGQEGAAIELTVDDDALPRRASFDFPPAWRRLFYGGFCNRALWPLLHGFTSRVRYEDEEWTQYVDANATYARLAAELVDPDATIWVHDYHLLLVAAALRHRGHRGPIGLFLHVPFPSRDVFETLPWGAELLDAMLAFDLIGVHTTAYAENFLAVASSVLGARASHGMVYHRHGETEVAPLPIGIDPEPFRHDAVVETSREIEGMRAGLGGRKLLLGVDRLDYSKGVPERLEAFERLLERHARWRRQVTMVQVSVPTRADVPAYAELRQRVENLVGRINGRFGDADWVPVRYLYRSYDHAVLAQLYRAADVAVVTPLRDGMNLVAKEFVAAQDPAQPGALVLSRFAGAAESLRDAVLTNPYHRDGLADDLDRALAMPLEERRARHARMLAAVLGCTAEGWAASFLTALRHARAAAAAAEPATADGLERLA
jgi:trehalose 6-phosphate synthase